MNEEKLEPMHVIINYNLNFNIGNVVKYIHDVVSKEYNEAYLKKAIEYVDFEIYKLKEHQDVSGDDSIYEIIEDWNITDYNLHAALEHCLRAYSIDRQINELILVKKYLESALRNVLKRNENRQYWNKY